MLLRTCRCLWDGGVKTPVFVEIAAGSYHGECNRTPPIGIPNMRKDMTLFPALGCGMGSRACYCLGSACLGKNSKVYGLSRDVMKARLLGPHLSLAVWFENGWSQGGLTNSGIASGFVRTRIPAPHAESCSGVALVVCFDASPVNTRVCRF